MGDSPGRAREAAGTPRSSDDGGHPPAAVVAVSVLPGQVGGGHEREALVGAAVLQKDLGALLAGGLPRVGQRRVPVCVAGHHVHAVLRRQQSRVRVAGGRGPGGDRAVGRWVGSTPRAPARRWADTAPEVRTCAPGRLGRPVPSVAGTAWQPALPAQVCAFKETRWFLRPKRTKDNSSSAISVLTFPL